MPKFILSNDQITKKYDNFKNAKKNINHIL